MRWPEWIDGYVPLREHMDRLARNEIKHDSPATHSSIRKEATHLISVFGRAFDRYLKLERESHSRSLRSSNFDELEEDCQIDNAKRLIISRLNNIAERHKDKDSRDQHDKYLINVMVEDAVDSGLKIRKSNVRKYLELFASLYENIGRKKPATSMLDMVKRKVKREGTFTEKFAKAAEGHDVFTYQDYEREVAKRKEN